MNKFKIEHRRSILDGKIFWVLKISDGPFTKTLSFDNWNAANNWLRKRQIRERKESSAFSMLKKISMNLITVAETEFIQKLYNTSCKGITPRQYGYLKGIYERQERAW